MFNKPLSWIMNTDIFKPIKISHENIPILYYDIYGVHCAYMKCVNNDDFITITVFIKNNREKIIKCPSKLFIQISENSYASLMVVSAVYIEDLIEVLNKWGISDAEKTIEKLKLGFVY